MKSTTVKLDGVMSIAKVEALHHELEDALRTGSDTSISAEGVERVDTSVLQTLLSFKQAMKDAGLKTSWGELSEEFVAAAELLGVAEQLEVGQ